MRSLRWFVAVFVAASLAAAPPTAPPSRSLKWDQLAGVIVGQPAVVVDLKDGSNVKGVPISVEAAALVLNVTSKSHPTYKRGRAFIPQAEITGLGVVTSRYGGRIGFLVGLAAGVGGATGIHLQNQNCSLSLIFVEPCHPIGGAARAGEMGVLIGAPVAGYFIGRNLDRHESWIMLPPDLGQGETK